MTKLTFWDNLRHGIKKIPFAEKIYNTIHVLLFPTLSQDGLITNHNAFFMKDEDYLRSYRVAKKQLERETYYPLNWRAHTLMWAGFHGIRLEKGDFVECGVCRAFMSSGVIDYIDFANQKGRNFYLFDTYCGLVDEQIKSEDIAASRNQYVDCYGFVVNTFKNFKNVHVIKGAVPDTLNTVKISKVCYLHIDMNCVLPEKEALEYFWPKIVSSGIVILDDYGFKGHEAQAEAADSFAESVGVKILCLPTGQGILVKP